jgi:hypothetical protein
MKNLDFFRQPRNENVKSTVYGGVISLFSLLLLAYGIFMEIHNFVGTTVDVEVTVENHPMASRTAILELNLTVLDVSCTLLNPMLTSEVSEMINSVEQNFVKTRIFQKDGRTHWVDERELIGRLEDSDSDEQLRYIFEKEVVKGESCNMYAQLHVPKTEGTLTIAAMVNPIVFALAFEFGHNTDIKNHEFHSLKFKNGAQGLMNEEEDNFFAQEFNDEIDLFDRIKEIETYTDNDKGMLVMYFTEVIPHVLYDEFMGTDLYSYSYSLNHNSKHIPEVNGISLNYDFSPLTMRLVKRHKPIGKLAINV